MNNYIEGLRIDSDLLKTDSYVKKIPALVNTRELRFDSPITFFVGENGSGKSTLLEAIAESYGFNKEGGTKNYRFSTFAEASELFDALTLFKGVGKAEYNYFFRAETFFNVASKEDEYSHDVGGIPEHFHEESHGESFLHLFRKIASARGIFLLDEPEAALSVKKQLSLFSLIYEAAKNGSQFIIVSHSPILLAIPGADLLSFDGEQISKISYEETESYKIIRSFLDHRELMIKELTK